MPMTVYNQKNADKFITGNHVDLVVVECTCGLLFAIPENLNKSALKHRGPNGWQISCPLGHTWHYSGPNAEERLRDRLAAAQADLDQTKASLRGQKIRASRFKNERDRIKTRVAHGVCPCCNRTFKQLARHMKGQHPEYVEATSIGSETA